MPSMLASNPASILNPISADSGIPKRLGETHPALVLVDVAMAYLTEGSPMFDARFLDALASCTRLADACRALDVPVIFTRVVYRAGGADGSLFLRKVPALAAFVDSNAAANFLQTLHPRDEEVVVTKQYALICQPSRQ